MHDGIILGSVERFTVTMQPSGESTLRSCSWRLIIRAQKSITLDKSDCIYIDDNTYDFILDSSQIGPGAIDIKLIIDIIDSNAQGGYRSVILKLPINTTVIR